jgi:hypothetical protein
MPFASLTSGLESSRTKCGTTWNSSDPDFAEKMAEYCAFIDK